MSPIEQVLAAAKSIANNGHKPSLALIKSRLGNSVPMPLLIQGLQQFKALPKSEWQHLPELEAIPPKTTDEQSNSPNDVLAHLNQQIIMMQQHINKLTQRVTQLETDLATNLVQTKADK